MSGELRLTRRGRVVVGVLMGALVALATVGVLALTAVPVAEPEVASAGASPSASPSPTPSPEPAPPRRLVRRPLPEGVMRVSGEQPAELVAGIVRALVREAPIVVVVDESDRRERDRAGALALRLHVPLLVDGPGLGQLLSDIGATTVVDVGAGVPATPDVDVVTVPASPSRVRDEAAALAATRGATVLERRLDWYRRTPVTVPAPLRAVAAPPEALPRPVPVLLPRDLPAAHPAAVTVAALGHRVVEVAPDELRAQPDLRSRLTDTDPDRTVALGDAGPWADADDAQLLADLGLVRSAPELPGGGWRLLPDRMLVALYGSPGTPSLGMLGEQDVAATVERARGLAAEYAEHVDLPVVPTFEIIATVASASAGPAGDYSARVPLDVLDRWVEAAGQAGLYVVLDLQPGRTDFLTQAKELEDLLRRPHVGLALDPEWRLAPHQRHLRQIGSVGIEEVNAVSGWLGALTREHRLPQKLLLLHQFKRSMIRQRDALVFPRELAVVIQMDGQGSQGGKLGTWRNILADPPPGVWWGWKNFEHEDRPMRGVSDTVALEPRPVFVSYQ